MKQTTKSGVSRLKKHKINMKAVFAAFISFSALFFSCKSLPAGNDVSAIELLDNESSFYIAIPKNADQDLITRIIQNNIEISEKDAKTLSDRIEKVYCGLNRSRNSTEIQVAVDASIPQKYIPSLLNTTNVGNCLTDNLNLFLKILRMFILFTVLRG